MAVVGVASDLCFTWGISKKVPCKGTVGLTRGKDLVFIYNQNKEGPMAHIIEINGIKMAVDERTATIQKVDTFKVGSPVKLLYKSYSSYEPKFGVIVGFDNFKKRPTIVIAYLDSTELKYAYLHEGTEHEMLAVEDHDLKLEKTWILDKMKERINKKAQELEDEKSKFEHFNAMFGKYFEAGTPDSSSVG